ncbi:sugar phosphate isomerase/epimerase family protein [Photobacterium angustum]|uniref:sugar phosphate isomerase/epimerase family protein n=1 Tax=Photobacterium angustum TaxID=661 RepID=UPI0005E2ABB7|nr:sugar phosphate isomerase/epimerase family protein [Photobacterium angustum]KJG18901.1 hypothetical protein UA33_02335 [Photobacterium angustum]KJG25408.1 hypothetical protein UA39_05635 [Photobacterium angustum]KJG33723.1 hypothetical protein UA36_01685 [Photobacterium angustum]PSW95861.1 sugar phosphate isomerase/epimerase [Photobacterium angustum]PSX02251.1 sugar phosphate isomerase/epimerase [Photobacterium angustum]
MKIGVFAKTYSGISPTEVLTKVHKAGYESVAYNMVCSNLSSLPLDVTEDVIEDLMTSSLATTVEIDSLSATYNMIHLSKQVRENGLASLLSLAKVANLIGCNLITLCTGTRCQTNQWHGHPDNNSQQAWDELVSEMRKAIQIAEQYNIYLGIEPELSNVINSATKAKQLIEQLDSDRVRIIFDPANLFEQATLAEQHHIIEESFNLLEPYIIQAHAKDRNADGSFGVTGKGILDYDFYIRMLINSGFQGDLIAHGFSEQDGQFVQDFLRKKVIQAGQ